MFFHWSMRNECLKANARLLCTVDGWGKHSSIKDSSLHLAPQHLGRGLSFLSFLSLVLLHWLFSTVSFLLKCDTYFSKFSSFSVNGPTYHFIEKTEGIIKTPFETWCQHNCLPLFSVLFRKGPSHVPLSHSSKSIQWPFKKYLSPSFLPKNTPLPQTHLQQSPYPSSSWPNSLLRVAVCADYTHLPHIPQLRTT